MSVELVHTLNGPPGAPFVVLSNSLGTTWEMWAPQAPALQTNLQLLRYNARGHGGSPAPPGPYEVADLGGDLLDLMDRLEIERASICGVSIGGMTAMWLAANHPERVERLVLCATSASMAPPEPWHERAAAVRADGVEPLIDATIERWFTLEFVADQPSLITRTRAMVASTDPEGYASCCEALAAWDFREGVAAIQAPTLVISADGDPAAPPDHGRLLAERIPDAHQEVVEDARHLVSLQRPEIVTPLILDHLEA